MNIEFDAQGELETIHAARRIQRKRTTWGRSKLIRFTGELKQLQLNGASLGDMQYWLRREKRVKANRSTIWRYLNKVIAL